MCASVTIICVRLWGVGSIKIKTHDGSVKPSLKLVPELKKNRICFGYFEQQGDFFMVGEGVLKIMTLYPCGGSASPTIYTACRVQCSRVTEAAHQSK